jgi:hypothetical protein
LTDHRREALFQRRAMRAVPRSYMLLDLLDRHAHIRPGHEIDELRVPNVPAAARLATAALDDHRKRRRGNAGTVVCAVMSNLMREANRKRGDDQETFHARSAWRRSVCTSGSRHLVIVGVWARITGGEN